jgi:hypothetical protein
LELKAPQKQPLQKVPERLDARPPERAKEPLDGVGEKHAVRLALGGGGIAGVLGQGIEVDIIIREKRGRKGVQVKL